MNIKKEPALIFSGLCWFSIGFFLLSKGLKMLVLASMAAKSGAPGPFVKMAMNAVPNAEQAVVILIVISLFLGYLKGRVALRKSALRISSRIMALKEPLKLSQIYPKGYYFLLGGMMLLGMSLKFLSLPLDIYGMVDTIIGSALVNGSLVYFREAIKKVAAR